MLEIAIVFIVLLVFIGVVYAIERQGKAQSGLPAGSSAPGMRGLALALGLVALGLFLITLTTSPILEVEFLILSIVLLGYALGAGLLVKKRRGDTSGNRIPPLETSLPLIPNEGDPIRSETLGTTLLANRLVRFGLTLAVVIALSAIAIYAAMWAALHPDSPVSGVLIIGFILLVVLARMRSWVGIFKK